MQRLRRLTLIPPCSAVTPAPLCSCHPHCTHRSGNFSSPLLRRLCALPAPQTLCISAPSRPDLMLIWSTCALVPSCPPRTCLCRVQVARPAATRGRPLRSGRAPMPEPFQAPAVQRSTRTLKQVSRGASRWQAAQQQGLTSKRSRCVGRHCTIVALKGVIGMCKGWSSKRLRISSPHSLWLAWDGMQD